MSALPYLTGEIEKRYHELRRRERARDLRNGRMLLAKTSRLFERVRHLQDAEVFFVAADDLQANRKSLWREASRH